MSCITSAIILQKHEVEKVFMSGRKAFHVKGFAHENDSCCEEQAERLQKVCLLTP